MPATCYQCGRYLPDVISWRMGGPMPDDAWHMTNLNKAGAAGTGQTVMVPVCNKCEPLHMFIPADTATARS